MHTTLFALPLSFFHHHSLPLSLSSHFSSLGMRKIKHSTTVLSFRLRGRLSSSLEGARKFILSVRRRSGRGSREAHLRSSKGVVVGFFRCSSACIVSTTRVIHRHGFISSPSLTSGLSVGMGQLAGRATLVVAWPRSYPAPCQTTRLIHSFRQIRWGEQSRSSSAWVARV